MSDPEEPLHDVGYGKPPRQSRFQPGKSGNPKGRPKGVKNFATAIEAELNTRVPVKENGKHRMISKRQAVIKQLLNRAAGGDLKAIQPLLSISNQHERQVAADGASASTDPFATPEDMNVEASILQRLRMAAGLQQPAEAPPEGGQDEGPDQAEEPTTDPTTGEECQ